MWGERKRSGRCAVGGGVVGGCGKGEHKLCACTGRVSGVAGGKKAVALWFRGEWHLCWGVGGAVRPLVCMLVLYNTLLQAAYMGRGITTGTSVLFHALIPAGSAVHGTDSLMMCLLLVLLPCYRVPG